MSRRGRGKKRPVVREAANMRIRSLYDLSSASARRGDLERARHYLELAKRISMRYTVRVSRDLKRSTCKGCMAPLLPDLTARIRTRNGAQVITCLECGKVKRYPLGKGRGSDEEE